MPEGTISGWLPSADGKLFSDRNARTLSEVTQWCAGKDTIGTDMVFDGFGGGLSDVSVHEAPCETS